ncbi:putative peptide maturation dehydrogenase [Oleiagrimonas soli]|uniref:Putative peptide maturation dehydrogenase n=1 Tax=Oleiagrimonas soli TaxID=1543381 RepID=A0A841KGH4_9GAMM|nr:putative peptide maturation dehydrogenase [Oleiagrimonas soli]MBB6184723.1 putative peptide maturation dehydrogenase [Oleiagrimonas soli]
MRIRRRRICFIQISDQLIPDFNALFSGEVKLDTEPAAELLCPIRSERLKVSGRELALLAELPADAWVDAGDLIERGSIDEEALASLVQRHIVLSDADHDIASKAILEAEGRFERVGWYDLTAMYHAMTRWAGMADDVATREHTPEAHRQRLGKIADRHGDIPPHFPRRADALSTHALELQPFDSPLATILKSRRTTRVFDADAVLSQADLSHMLYGCFGAQGIRELAPGATAVKRTSASGGGLTPIDPYPVILRVEGLKSGVYHYDMSRHALELLREVDEQVLREQFTAFTAGQDYFAQAHVMIVHVGRFNRHHWKYRRHMKAYKALLMDSAHLSQTFYLLATERGLGAYYTAAINDAQLSEYLGLDPIEAAPFGVSGLGVKGPDKDAPLHFNPEPFTPNFQKG